MRGIESDRKSVPFASPLSDPLIAFAKRDGLKAAWSSRSGDSDLGEGKDVVGRGVIGRRIGG